MTQMIYRTSIYVYIYLGKINTAALPPPERMPSTRIDKQEPTIVSQSIVLNEQIFFGFWKEMFPDIKLEESTNIDNGSTTGNSGGGGGGGKRVFADSNQVKIALIWKELLGTYEFGSEDNFFDLGGHSLMATRLMFLIK